MNCKVVLSHPPVNIGRLRSNLEKRFSVAGYLSEGQWLALSKLYKDIGNIEPYYLWSWRDTNGTLAVLLQLDLFHTELWIEPGRQTDEIFPAARRTLTHIIKAFRKSCNYMSSCDIDYGQFYLVNQKGLLGVTIKVKSWRQYFEERSWHQLIIYPFAFIGGFVLKFFTQSDDPQIVKDSFVDFATSPASYNEPILFIFLIAMLWAVFLTLKRYLGKDVEVSIDVKPS